MAAKTWRLRRRDADGRFATMNLPAPAIERRRSADGTFYLLAGISLLLVALIAADGVRKGLDTIVPAYYRHLASLSIAISELAHGTSDMVGLVEVDKALEQSGYSLDPPTTGSAFSIPIRPKPTRRCEPLPISPSQIAARRSACALMKQG